MYNPSIINISMPPELEEKHEDIQSNQLIFDELELDNIKLFKDYFKKKGNRSCDFSIGGIYIWKNLFDYSFARYGKELVIKGYLKLHDVHVFYLPVEAVNDGSLPDLIDNYCLTNNIKGIILTPEEENLESSENFEFNDNCYLPEYKEYLYPIEKFCGFPGKKMEKKRNHLHFFEKNYSPYFIEIIDSSIIPDLTDFTLKFDSEHCDSELADYECREVIEVLKNFSSYPFEGIAIRKNGDVIGYSFGERIGDTFIIHAEKGNTNYRGIYQAIASELAKYVASRYPEVRYLNREDDMGDESLRQSKLSYHPSMFIHKKIISVG